LSNITIRESPTWAVVIILAWKSTTATVAVVPDSEQGNSCFSRDSIKAKIFGSALTGGHRSMEAALSAIEALAQSEK
jgi:hypothetical protein